MSVENWMPETQDVLAIAVNVMIMYNDQESNSSKALEALTQALALMALLVAKPGHESKIADLVGAEVTGRILEGKEKTLELQHLRSQLGMPEPEVSGTC